VFADPGDRVEVDEPIAQVETDKVCVEPVQLHLLEFSVSVKCVID